MESKIEITLTDMSEILAGYYPHSHKKLYALKRLGIEAPKVHHTLRKKELVECDKRKLVVLLHNLNRYTDYYEIDSYSKYYINRWRQNLVEILNSA